MHLIASLTFAHFEEMARLEQCYYSEEYITPPREAYAWYQKYPYTVIAAEEAGEIAGFVNLFPVTPTCFQQLRQGTFKDRELTVEEIAQVQEQDADPLYLYLCCIVVKEPFRKKQLTPLLLDAAIRQYEKAAHRCRWILADHVTPQGEAFSRRYGFSPVRESNHHSWIYEQPYAAFVQNVRRKLNEVPQTNTVSFSDKTF